MDTQLHPQAGNGIPRLHLALLIGGGLGVLGVLAAASIAALTGAEERLYSSLVSRISGARDSLAVNLWLAAGALFIVASVLTWFVVVYRTFRIAGPLYRFRKNVETVIDNVEAPLIPLRESDILTRQSAGLNDAVASLRSHYAAIGEECDRLTGALEPQGNDSVDPAQLQRIVARARLNTPQQGG